MAKGPLNEESTAGTTMVGGLQAGELGQMAVDATRWRLRDKIHFINLQTSSKQGGSKVAHLPDSWCLRRSQVHVVLGQTDLNALTHGEYKWEQMGTKVFLRCCKLLSTNDHGMC